MSALPPFTSCTLSPAHFFCQLSTGRLLPASTSMSFAAQTADYFSAQYFSAQYFLAENGGIFHCSVFQRDVYILVSASVSFATETAQFFLQAVFWNVSFKPSFAPRSVEQTQQATVTFKIAFVITDNKNTSRNIHRPSSQRKHVKVEQKIWLNIDRDTDLLVHLFQSPPSLGRKVISWWHTFFWSQCCCWFGLGCFERPIHNFFQPSKS